MSEDGINSWVKAGVITYVIFAIVNPLIVLGKELNADFKGFFINFGGSLGIEHHLYGHIMLLIILFIVFVLLFAFTPLNNSIGGLLKLNDYGSANKYTFWATIISSGAITVLFAILWFTH